MLEMLTVVQLVTITLVFRRVRKTAKRDYWLRHVCPSFRLTAWNNSTPIEWGFMKFDISVFVEKSVEKSEVPLKYDITYRLV